MKILVCGVGSIGERHIRNLIKLGYNDIYLLRKRNLPLRTIDSNFPVINSCEEALALGPDIIFITNPSFLHAKYLITLKQCNSHFFVEKPLASSFGDVENIINEFANYGPNVMVGYMMRFHPMVRKLKSMVDQKVYGEVIGYESCWRDYLPDWHPWEDYRQSYAAKSSMGGGPTLTLSHELDLMFYLLGEPQQCHANFYGQGQLELECEHGIEIVYEYEDSLAAKIVLDYCTTPPKRHTKIVFEKAIVDFSYFDNELLASPADGEEELYKCHDFERNDMFYDELAYFFDRCKKNQVVSPDLKEGCIVASLALDALKEGKDG